MVLKGLGASVALPWLESVRAWGAPAAAADKSPPKRFAFLFFGDGIHPPEWWAKGDGAQMELGPALKPLEAVKGKINFIDGLTQSGSVLGGHAKGAAGMLTGEAPKGGRDIHAGSASLDQMLAQKMGESTVLPSLVLGCERPVSGFHESGYSMMYASHLSWRSPVTPVPAEMYPAMAFDSLFESKGSAAQRSVLDHVLGQLQSVAGGASHSDKAKIDEYTTSVREVEQRLAKLQAQPGATAETTAALKAQRPADALPGRLDEHVRLMCDVIALAFQADRTRIATLLLTNNLSGQVYPFLGLRDDHHSFSHNCNGKEFAAITRFWAAQYAYLLSKLDGMQEGDGTVLDNCCVMLANEQWTFHNAEKVPLVLGGGLGGKVKTGRTLDYTKSKDRKMCSLYLSILDHLGMPLPRFGDATQQLPGF